MLLTSYQSTQWIAATLFFFMLYTAYRFATTGTLSIWDIFGTTGLFFIWYIVTYVMANFLTFNSTQPSNFADTG